MYIYRLLKVYFPGGKKINSHISLAGKTVISSSITLFYPGSNKTPWYDFGRETKDNLVAKLKYVGENERKITLCL